MTAPVALAGTTLGLLSDSHGRVPVTRRAVRALLDAGADAIVHLGDICAVEVIDELAGLTGPGGGAVPARLVFGNIDDDVDALSRYARALGVAVDHPAGRLSMAGKVIVTHHGHDPSQERAAVRSGAGYLCHGHTHRLRDVTVGPTRIINPGALFRAPRYTAAALDCATGLLTVVTIGAEG